MLLEDFHERGASRSLLIIESSFPIQTVNEAIDNIDSACVPNHNYLGSDELLAHCDSMGTFDKLPKIDPEVGLTFHGNSHESRLVSQS